MVLATTVERYARGRHRPDDAEQRQETGDELVRDPDLDEPAAAAPRDKLRATATSSSLARSTRPSPTGSGRPARRPVTGSPSRPSRCGSTRRPAAARIRRSRPISSASSTARAPASTASSRHTRTPLAGSATRRSSPSATRAVGRSSTTATVVEPGVPGQDVRLTIDAGLQLAVEQELLAAWVADDAKSVSAVVMDPYTGEVYAEATFQLRRQRLPRDRRQAPDASSTRSSRRLRARLRVQDDDRDRRPRDRRGHLSTQDQRHRHAPARRGQDQGRRRGPQGMGWMTFEDGVAYSRNVVAAKVALGLGKTTRAVVGDPLRHVAQARLRRADRHRRRRRGRPASCATRPHAVAPDRPRQRRLRPGRRRHADPARDGLRDADQRRDADPAARRQGGRRRRRSIGRPAPGSSAGALATSSSGSCTTSSTTVPFYSTGTLVPGYDVGGKTGTAQIWDPKAKHGRGGWKVNLFNYSFIGYIGADAASRTSSSRSASRRASRPSYGSGSSRCR